MTWQDITLVGMIITAVVVLQLASGPDNAEVRSTVLALVAGLSSWLSNGRTNREVSQLKHEVEALRDQTPPAPGR